MKSAATIFLCILNLAVQGQTFKSSHSLALGGQSLTQEGSISPDSSMFRQSLRVNAYHMYSNSKWSGGSLMIKLKINQNTSFHAGTGWEHFGLHSSWINRLQVCLKIWKDTYLFSGWEYREFYDRSTEVEKTLRGKILPDGGLFMKVQTVQLGIMIHNNLRYTVNVAYPLSEKLCLSMEIEQQNEKRRIVKSGIFLRINEKQNILLGYNSASSLSIGWSGIHKNICFSFAASHHPILGMSGSSELNWYR